jgi:hypothetical protein
MPFTIDVHHHILPDFFWRETNDAHAPVGGVVPAAWSREDTLAFMDEAEIDGERKKVFGETAVSLLPRLVRTSR